MSTFKYHTAPNSKGGFTTRVVLGDQTDEAALSAAIAAAAGITPAQVEATLRSFGGKILEAAAGGGWSPSLYGTFYVRPSSGGSAPSPDDFNTPADLNADVTISFLAPNIDAWQSTLTLESQGEVGKVSPVIDSIISQEDGAANHYLPGTMIELRGNNLRFQKTDPTQGVFFRSGSAAEVRATVYGTVDPGSLSVLVPATLSGPLIVRVAAHINGSVRSFTYMDPITD